MRLLTLLLLLSVVSRAQQKKEVSLGYAEQYDSLPVIVFQPSSQAAYDKCKVAPAPVKMSQKADVQQLVIPARPAPIRLKKYHSDEKAAFQGYEYSGYLPELKMHVVTAHHTAEHIGFSDLSLIDSLTGYWYNIVSIGDDAVETPVPSPGGRYLVYYYNHIYEKNSSFIGVLTVNRSASPLLAEKTSAATKAWGVEGIRWTDDNAFIVKAFVVEREGGQQSKQYQYFLARLNR